MNKSIRMIISDLDGTLIDTYKANLEAYKEAFKKVANIELSETDYKNNFGLKFSELCDALNVSKEFREDIKTYKKNVYKNYFKYTNVNNVLIKLLKEQKENGLIIALGTTASKENVMNILNYHNLTELFNYILTGDEVKNGKPNSEVYDKIMKQYNMNPKNTLIYEDSDVGVVAAINSGAYCVRIEKWN